MYVRVLGDDGPLKITIYQVTWIPPGYKAFTYSHFTKNVLEMTLQDMTAALQPSCV